MNDTNINNTLVNVEITENTTDFLHEVYEDSVKPVAKETGKIVGRIPRLINAVLSPIDSWILNKEYNLAETKKLLEQKLRDVDPEKIVTPEPYVAVPAIHAISYSMNNSELRDLYANLLAKSMISYTKDNVHPAFVETIKQMSPVDAKVFKVLSSRKNNAMIHLNRTFAAGGFEQLETNITGLSIATHDILSASIDNLEKLKLIKIPEGEYITSDFPYQNIYRSEEYVSLLKKYRAYSSQLEPSKKNIRITSFGNIFRKICF